MQLQSKHKYLLFKKASDRLASVSVCVCVCACVCVCVCVCGWVGAGGGHLSVILVRMCGLTPFIYLGFANRDQFTDNKLTVQNYHQQKCKYLYSAQIFRKNNQLTYVCIPPY